MTWRPPRSFWGRTHLWWRKLCTYSIEGAGLQQDGLVGLRPSRDRLPHLTRHIRGMRSKARAWPVLKQVNSGSMRMLDPLIHERQPCLHPVFTYLGFPNASNLCTISGEHCSQRYPGQYRILTYGAEARDNFYCAQVSANIGESKLYCFTHSPKD